MNLEVKIHVPQDEITPAACRRDEPLTVSLNRSNEVSVQEEVHVGEIRGGTSVHYNLVQHLKHTHARALYISHHKLRSRTTLEVNYSETEMITYTGKKISDAKVRNVQSPLEHR